MEEGAADRDLGPRAWFVQKSAPAATLGHDHRVRRGRLEAAPALAFAQAQGPTGPPPPPPPPAGSQHHAADLWPVRAHLRAVGRHSGRGILGLVTTRRCHPRQRQGPTKGKPQWPLYGHLSGSTRVPTVRQCAQQVQREVAPRLGSSCRSRRRQLRRAGMAAGAARPDLVCSWLLRACVLCEICHAPLLCCVGVVLDVFLNNSSFKPYGTVCQQTGSR